MPAPSTVDEFVELVRKSAVLDESRLTTYVQKLKRDASTPSDLSGVAGVFVRDGLLTYFQAEQFLQGRWKRFTIGKYKVLEKLGSGGMGQVFLCEHKLMRRRVAVKVLPTAKAADPSSLERFYREARAVAALDHVNIVRAYDIDQDDNLHFLVMEYVDGASLQDMIRKGKRMDVTRACHYIYWSAIGLQHAHAAGLIHRDIKPGNILVDRTGVVKILDLGLARFFHDEDDLLTKKYDESVLGTADYLAPEQAIDSHTVDGRADIYSLGATFYFMLTGSPPFAEGSVAQKLLWHQTRSPKSIQEVRPDVPENVAAILEKMMAKKPEDRYATPEELAEALLPLTQTPIGPPPDVEMPQLSAAAMGTSSGPVSVASGPRTTVPAPRTPMPVHGAKAPVTPEPKAGSSRRSKPNTAIAEADTQKNRPVPLIEPIPDSNAGTPIWEVISAETANASRTDTDRTKRDQPSRKSKLKQQVDQHDELPESSKSNRRRGSAPRTSPFLILGLIAGVLIIVGGAFAAYWFGIREKPKPEVPPVSIEPPRTLYLSKNSGGAALHFSSLAKAIEEFRPGDAIVVKDDEWEEYGAVTRTKGFVLRAADGKRVIWRIPAHVKSPQERAVMTLYGTEGARISGITFDAGGLAANAIRLSGPCPDLVLDNVQLVNATLAAVSIHDCAGSESHPITIRNCRLANSGSKDCRAGVSFTSDGQARKNSNNNSIRIHDCVLEGPFTEGAFNFSGTATGIEIRHCRVWKAAHGVCFNRTVTGQASWQVNLTANTFHTITASTLRIEDVNQLKARPENRIVVAQNFFADTPVIAAFEAGDLAGNTFLVAEANSNVRKAGTNPGNFPIPIAEVVADVPTNPADPSKFLLYDKTSILFTASNGKPAGVPPK